MSWWGTVIGGAFGFLVGGPLGALLGAALGRNFDQGLNKLPGAGAGGRAGHYEPQERIQTAFFTATFSVMGHICKADGLVSSAEIRVARHVMAQMQLNPEQMDAAMALFNAGKQPGFSLEAVLQQLRAEIGHRQTLKRMFIEIQCIAATADEAVDQTERKLLLHICDVIGFNRAELEGLLTAFNSNFHRGQQASSPARTSASEAYKILGVKASDSNDEVKKAYRRLISQHHPDKLVSKGLPEEMIKIATARTHEIRQAYELLKEKRGF
jgi:DnaJ like chaperone protein